MKRIIVVTAAVVLASSAASAQQFSNFGTPRAGAKPTVATTQQSLGAATKGQVAGKAPSGQQLTGNSKLIAIGSGGTLTRGK